MWLLLEFAGRAFADTMIPSVSELLGFSTPAPRRAVSSVVAPMAVGPVTRRRTLPLPPLPLMSRVWRRRLNVVEPAANDGAPASVAQSVKVISRRRRPGTTVGSWAPRADGVPEPGADVSGPDGYDAPIDSSSTAPMGRDLGAAAPAPQAGDEPAPGETVVLVGDDVESWVRERLYGGHGGRLRDR